MALIECPDCGKKISNQSAACIGCGRPVNDEEINNIIIEPSPEGKYLKPSLIIIAGLLVNIVVSILFYKSLGASGYGESARGGFLFLIETSVSVFTGMLISSLILFPLIWIIRMITKKWISLVNYAVLISIIQLLVILFASYNQYKIAA